MDNFNFQAQYKGGKFQFMNINFSQHQSELGLQDYIENVEEIKAKTFCHNLNMEGGSLTLDLVKLGYTFVNKVGTMAKSFSRIDDNNGNIMSFTIRNSKRNITIVNSMLKINATVEELRTAAEDNDLVVVAKQLKTFIDQGLTKNTYSADAFKKYLDITFGGDKDLFRQYFPTLSLDTDTFIRKAYFGGWCHLNKKIKSKKSYRGKTYDVNSLYPSVMKDNLMPYGKPVYFKGKPSQNQSFPLFIVKVKIDWCEIKDKHFPFIIDMPKVRTESEKEYIESGEGVVCYLTNMELELFKSSYDYGNITYIEGYKFRAERGFFDKYINHYNSVKMNSDKKSADYRIAKLMLNGLGGKFGSKLKLRGINLRFEDGIEVKTQGNTNENKHRMVYTAVAVFMTSYGRCKTIQAANDNYDNFIYADTDSIHVRTGLFRKKIKGIEIDNNKLGCWKEEITFTKSKFICRKCYGEFNGDWHFTIAGLQTEALTDIKDFYLGSRVKHNVKVKTKDGYAIQEGYFTIGTRLLDKKLNTKGVR